MRGNSDAENPAIEEEGALDMNEDDQDDTIEDDPEDGAQTDEDADKRQFGIYQCLPVDDREPDWQSGEPESVEEYLRRVR
jgi:hypothetical protein